MRGCISSLLKLSVLLFGLGALKHDCLGQAISDSFREHHALRLGAMTNTSNEGIAVLTDIDGNLYVVGHTTPTAQNNIATLAVASPNSSFTRDWERRGYGGQDVFIAKITATGELAYIRTVGSPFDDFVTSAAIDKQGSSIYLTGNSGGVVSNFSNPAKVASAVRHASDPFIGRFDAATGNQTWLSSNGSTASDDSSAIALSIDEQHIYVGGSVGGSFVAPVETGRSQALIIKLVAESGELSWARQREIGSTSSSVEAIHVIAGTDAKGESYEIVRVAATVDNEGGGDKSQAARRRDAALLALDGRDGTIMLEHIDERFADTAPVSLTSDQTTGRGMAFVASQYFSDKVKGYEFSCARFDFNISSEGSAAWKTEKMWETPVSSLPPSGRILGVADLTAGAVMSPSGAEIVVFGSSSGTMTDSGASSPGVGEDTGIGTTTVVLKFLAKTGAVTYTAQSPQLGEGSWARAKGGALAFRGSAAAKAWTPGDEQDVLLLTGSARSNSSGAGTDVLLFAAGVPPTATDVAQEGVSTVDESDAKDIPSDTDDDDLSPSTKLGAGIALGVVCTIGVVTVLGLVMRYVVTAALERRSASSSAGNTLDDPVTATVESDGANYTGRAGAAALC